MSLDGFLHKILFVNFFFFTSSSNFSLLAKVCVAGKEKKSLSNQQLFRTLRNDERKYIVPHWQYIIYVCVIITCMHMFMDRKKDKEFTIGKGLFSNLTNYCEIYGGTCSSDYTCLRATRISVFEARPGVFWAGATRRTRIRKFYRIGSIRLNKFIEWHRG